MKVVVYLVLFISLSACSEKLSTLKTSPSHPIFQYVDPSNTKLKPVFENSQQYEVQILYTQINRDEYNVPSFTHIPYRINPLQYFYPASTVKMPTAFIALEKLEGLQSAYPGIHLYSPMKTFKGNEPQTAALLDSTSQSGYPSIGHYINKLFTVSNNDAYNRLYEFIGQEALNLKLKEHGYYSSVIRHRLGDASFTFEDNLVTNPIRIMSRNGLDFEQEQVISEPQLYLDLYGTQKGIGYFAKGEKKSGPFDFSKKNFMSLPDLNQVLKDMIFPNGSEKVFKISDEGRQHLLKAMSILPRESKYPKYPESDFQDSYVKFFMFGDSKKRIPDEIRIFNKVGFAYGYLTDVAYVVDFKNKVEFMLAATIHVNENQIYNDNQYEYDEVGIPFLAELGRQIYEYELKRKKEHLPNLFEFRFEY